MKMQDSVLYYNCRSYNKRDFTERTMKINSKNTPGGIMLGVGLDSGDGHKRVTRGDNFYLVGGSEETHERMTETAVKVNEKLARKGKRLSEIDPEEFADMVREASR